VYKNSDKYIGEWVLNKKHGKGKFVFKNGDYFEGVWQDDNLVERKNMRYAY
jgi:hypothetical protein